MKEKEKGTGKKGTGNRKHEISDERQTLTVPAHHELDRGTLRAIVRQASKCIDSKELKKRFSPSEPLWRMFRRTVLNIYSPP